VTTDGGPDAPLSDTSPEIEALLLARWRAMSPATRLRVVFELSEADDALAMAGIRRRHPSAGEREIRMRLVALKYGRDLALDAFAWDPDVHGW
jgi:hypothetical protein